MCNHFILNNYLILFLIESMEIYITKEMHLEEFNQIVVNVQQEDIPIYYMNKDNEEESKPWNNQRIRCERNEESLFVPEIYSIKDVTNNKTENDILELIRYELGIAEDDAVKWNKMVSAISRLRVSDDYQMKGEKIFISNIESFCY